MKTDYDLQQAAADKIQEAIDIYEVICLRHNDCYTCPLNTRPYGPVLPGDGEDKCAYHTLASLNWGKAWKMCPSCEHFHEGSCLLEKKNDEVDLEVACNEYDPKTKVDERLAE